MGDTGLMDPSRAVKAGKLVGADYFLTGQISFFVASETIKANPYVEGRYMHDCALQIRVDMRIVDTRTSKIVAAEVGEAKLEKKFQDRGRPFSTRRPSRWTTSSDLLVDKLTIKVIDGVYPIKVIGWTDGTAFLNRGEGGGLEVGQVLEVFGLGEEMKDPDTGASLGFTESKLGALQVTSVEAKFSKAAILSGTQMPKGSICRKAKDAPVQAPAEQPKRGPQGW